MQKSKNYPPDENAAFVERQVALEELERIKKEFSAAEKVTNEAYLTLQKAEGELNEAYEAMSELRRDQLQIWNDFEAYRREKLIEISALRDKILKMGIEQSQLEQERNRKSTKNNRAIRASIVAIEKECNQVSTQMSHCYDELQARCDEAKRACDFEEMRDYRDKKNTYVLRRLEYDLAKQRLAALEAALKLAMSNVAKKEASYKQLCT